MAGCLCATAMLCIAAPAAAHPPPYGRAVVTHGQGDTRTIGVLTNRGVMLSHDDGGSWRFTCYEAIGYTASQRPPLAFTEDGHLLLATFMGPVRSDSTLCDYAVVDGPLSQVAVPTMARAPQDASSFHATSGVAGADNGHYRSDDSGQSWSLVGATSDEVILERLRLSPSDPQRAYASGLDLMFNYFVARSDDAGQTWTQSAFALEDGELSVYLLAVHPTDPDTLFAHVLSRDGTVLADRLVRSTDAGASWETITDVPGLSDFAIAPDGSTAWVGGVDGLLRSEDGGASFAPVGAVTGVTCLAHIDDVLWICGQYSPSDVGVVTSTDGGEGVELALRFDEVDSLLQCAAGTGVADACAAPFAEWQREVLGIGTGDDAGPPRVIDTRVIDTGNGGTATGDAAVAMPPTGQPGEDSGGGCGCRVAPGARGRVDAAGNPWQLMWLALGSLFVGHVRRRRVL